jgi:hypothetical protein
MNDMLLEIKLMSYFLNCCFSNTSMVALQISEKIHNLYFSVSTGGVVTSVRIRWAEHVVCKVEIRCA